MRMLSIAIFGLLCTALLTASLGMLGSSHDVVVTMKNMEKPSAPPTLVAWDTH